MAPPGTTRHPPAPPPVGRLFVAALPSRLLYLVTTAHVSGQLRTETASGPLVLQRSIGWLEAHLRSQRLTAPPALDGQPPPVLAGSPGETPGTHRETAVVTCELGRDNPISARGVEVWMAETLNFGGAICGRGEFVVRMGVTRSLTALTVTFPAVSTCIWAGPRRTRALIWPGTLHPTWCQSRWPPPHHLCVADESWLPAWRSRGQRVHSCAAAIGRLSSLVRGAEAGTKN
jgi:hypothetical protein